MNRPRRRRHIGWWLLLAAIVVLMGIAFAIMWRPALAPQNTIPSFDQARIERGANLAHLGMCASCHTADLSPPFAGGKPMETPFGTVHSTNITPDADTGIGAWSPGAFTRAMREGVSRDGHLLYPAFPYNHYVRMTQADIDDLYAWFMTRPAITSPARDNDMTFPFGFRPLVGFWNVLYLNDAPWRPDPRQSAEWNRGAYLVEGLGHCAMCHTPINALGGSSQERAFQGGLIPMQNWYAPSLTSNKEAGLGTWDLQDIIDLLQKGVSNRGTVYGPMAEVTFNSLQFLTTEDVRAMAVYLKSLPADQPLANDPAAAPARANITQQFTQGKRIYDAQCANCHGAQGRGKLPHYPPLAANQSITMTSAVNPIRMVLNGGYPPGTRRNPMPYGMPPFAHSLSDADIAAVVTYIRTAWGNRGAPVSVREVNDLRAATVE